MDPLSDEERQNLITLNRLDELLEVRHSESIVGVAAVTRSATKKRRPAEVVQEALVQRIRVDRILKVQEEEPCIATLKTYLVGDLASLTVEDAKMCTVIGKDYEVDESGLLYFCNLDQEFHKIEQGIQVWLYLDRVREGYARKLAHMWHDLFRVAATCGDHAVKLEIVSTPSKLKQVTLFPERHKSVVK